MRKPHPPPRWLLCYGVAIIAVGLALLVRMAIDPYLHDHLPYVTFFVAVTVAAWSGGLGPALLSTALGFLAAACFFIAPRGAFWIANTGDAIGIVSYFVVTLAIALFSHAMHKAREQALLRQHELEREVAVRRQAEREQEIASEFLALVNASTGTRQLAESAAHFFKTQSGCEAVAIRLREGDDCPCCEAHETGYESVALIALRVGEDHLGSLQLNDRSRTRFTPDMTALWEKLAGYLAVALAKARAEEALHKENREIALANSITRVFVQEEGDDLFDKALKLVLEGTHNLHGVFGYIDERGHLICPSMSRLLDECEVAGKCIHYPPGKWKGLWSRALLEKRALYTNEPARVPAGHVPIRRNLAAPILFQDRVIGLLNLANKESDYTEEDQTLIETIANRIAPVLYAWIQKEMRENERKGAEEELNIARLNAEHARALAEEANKAKDHFLAVLSHELRTPLNPALMAATILDGNPQLPPDLREDVAIIRRNVELEARLIDDMLDLTRIARGKLTLNRRIVDGREVLQHAIQTCDADAMNKYLALELTTPDEPLWVDADPARLQQVFWNLLKNAIKFTPEHGRITVIAAASAEGGLHVEVRDTGKGIAPEALTSIFDAFEQGGSNVTRRYGGLGLGLAICKGLVAMHDGSIHAASEGLGKGATFIVELPPAQRQGQAPSQQPTTQAGDAASSTDGGYRILLVEDHESTAAMTTRLLRSFGHRVSTADSIKSALARFADEPFDLVISDLGLPDGTGHDLIRQVLAQRPVPAIALSGYGMDGDIQQSTEAGFLEHLVKPINIRQLEAAIARATQQKGTWEHR